MNLLNEPFWISSFSSSPVIDIVVNVGGKHFPANKNILCHHVSQSRFGKATTTKALFTLVKGRRDCRRMLVAAINWIFYYFSCNRQQQFMLDKLVRNHVHFRHIQDYQILSIDHFILFTIKIYFPRPFETS